MEDQRLPLAVNFVDPESDIKNRRKKFVSIAVFILFITVVSAMGAAASYRSVKRHTTVLSELGGLPVISNIRGLVFGAQASASLTKNDQYLTILLLGVGGPGHEGSQLTDTMILTTIDKEQGRVSLLSIPRDLAYPLGNGQYEKINAVNAYEEQDHPGEGARRTADKVGELLGINIDDAVKIDFSGFTSFIDAIGGVDVTVERAFEDPQYPTKDDGWTAISFQKGYQHMDGHAALVFVRSRHGTNGEGSDFARSRRQQLVLMAVRDKLLSLNTLADPGSLSRLYSAVADHIQSTLNPWQMATLAPLAYGMDRKALITRQLTSDNDGLLENVTIAGSYLLMPRNNDWEPVKQLAQDPFAENAVTTASTKTALATVEVRNGTLHTGFASQASERLTTLGFRITDAGNATRRSYQRTTVYDLTNGSKPKALDALRSALKADLNGSEYAAATPSGRPSAVWGEGLTKEPLGSNPPDFLVILGEATYPL